VLGYTPRTGFADGMKRAIDWIRNSEK